VTAPTSTWALISHTGKGSSGPRAHRVEPAGGDGYWRTGCGQIVAREPWPADPDTARCRRCIRQLDGSQAGRPVIHGQHLHETRGGGRR